MRVAILGAGFTGLTIAQTLQKQGFDVTIFERESIPGGLATGFSLPDWQWSLEKHYHHIFTSDTSIIDLARQGNCPFEFHRPKTSSYINSQIFQLDSPLNVLTFSKFSILERLRMASALGYLKYLSDWKALEQQTAHNWLSKQMGLRPYKMLWEPLLKGKFGNYYKSISLAWFWARIKARTTQLGYPEGGFQQLADSIARVAINNGATFQYKSTVTHIEKKEKTFHVRWIVESNHHTDTFDRVVLTVPNALVSKLVPSLPKEYVSKLDSFTGIGAINMVFVLSEKFLPDNTYWLNICDESFPFLAVVEHTNFIDKKYYGNNHILYVGKYLDANHRYFSMSKEEIENEYRPYLRNIHPNYEPTVLSSHVFKVPFAQPLVTSQYSKKVLPFETPMSGLYLSNMQQIYPWDRGTNFAVEWGNKLAREIVESKKM